MSKPFIILLFVLCQGAFSARASHIMGGSIVFKHVQGNEYYVGLEVLIDCFSGNQAAFYDVPLHMGMYAKGSNTLVRDMELSLQPGFDDTVNISKRSCAEKVDFCMFVASYSAVFDFDPTIYNDPQGYYLSWERCCRNQVILNIRDPKESGIAYYAEIPPFSMVNSLPTFSKLPLNLLCVNTFFKYNFNIVDADGDSLVMSLVTPLKGRTSFSDDNSKTSASFPLLAPAPYTEIVWADGFNLENIMGGNPKLAIDASTGIVTVLPKRQGDYVFAIKVEEYRKGVKIGEVTRELQYKVAICASNEPPTIDQEIDKTTYSIYAGEELNLDFIFNDEEGDSVFIEATSPLLNTDIIGLPTAQFQSSSAKGKGKATFMWKPSCQQVNAQPYQLILDISDNGCPFPSTVRKTLYIEVLQPPKIEKPQDFCVKRISEDSLLLSWNLADYPSYFSGLVVEMKQNGGAWQAVDTIKPKRIKELGLKAPGNNQVDICFRISALNICGVLGEASDTFCSILHVGKAPGRPQLLNVTVNEKEQIELFWSLNTDFDFNSYQIYRSINGDVFDFYARVFTPYDTFFVDSLVNADSNFYTYYIRTIDDCSDVSTPSEHGSSILLKGQILPFQNVLNWNRFKLWSLENYELNGTSQPEIQVLQTTLAKTDTVYIHELNSQDQGIWQYRLAAKGISEKAISYSNTLNLSQKPVVFIPNAFSPNRDNLNETWDIHADFVSEYLLQVYNRWGQRVFESENPFENWNAETEMEGTYLYKLSYRSLEGRIFFVTGSVHIIR